MSGNQDPSKRTYNPYKERISLSYASLALLGTMAAALGAAFMQFYAAVCTPQIISVQAEKRELLDVLNKLTMEVQTNTKSIQELKNQK